MKSVLFFILLSTVSNVIGQKFILTESHYSDLGVKNSIFFVKQRVKLLSKYPVNDFILSSTDIDIKRISNKDYVLYNTNTSRDSVKILVCKRRNNSIVDSIILKTDYCSIEVKNSLFETDLPYSDTFAFRNFYTFWVWNSYLRYQTKLQSFDIEISDSLNTVIYSCHINKLPLDSKLFESIKTYYHPNLDFVVLKNIYITEGKSLLFIPKYIYRYPGFFSDKDSSLRILRLNQSEARRIIKIR